MNIEIQAPWEVNDYLKDIIHKKLDKLAQYNSRIQKTNVFLKKEGTNSISNKIFELRIQTPGHLLFAESQKDSFEKAIADATEKMRTQLIKLREQQTKHQ